jgi:dolichol-phosphate mannosyltransferase
MSSEKPLISIITPVYNEEENLKMYFERMFKVLKTLENEYNFEIVMTDNRSSDRSFEIIRSYANQDPRIRAFRLSKNFGYQKSIFTGYSVCRGHAAIEFDCDLQDPPEMLPLFLEKWRQGYQVIYGVRKSRQEGWMISAARKVFYRILRYISENDLPNDAGDFMLIDRRVLQHLKSISDQNIYIRGIVFSFGYKRCGIDYERDPRVAGESKFSIPKLVGLALDGIISQSIVPLRLASYIGFAVSILTALGSVVYFLLKLKYGFEIPRGFTTTTILILLSTSLNSIFLGIIGEYLARIYQQVKWRPLTIVDEVVDYTNSEKESS